MFEGAERIGEAWTLASFTAAIHRGGVGLWAWSPARRLAQHDGLCRDFWGTTESVVGLDTLFGTVNAEDREGMMLNWAASATEPPPYSFDFRIGEGPDARWISARGVGGDEGREWVQAIFLDITDRILAPYRTVAAITVDVSDAAMAGTDTINDYAMIFHELATNSAKYGALSGGGTLSLTGHVDGGTLRFVWEEGATPSGTPKAEGTGFGSRLLRQTIEWSLRGTFTRTIDAGGLR